MKDTTLKLGTVALGVITTTAIVASGVYAFGGNRVPVRENPSNISPRTPRGNLVQRKGIMRMGNMKEALDASDYSLLGEDAKITEEQFQNMERVYAFMKDGKFEEAKALKEELGMGVGFQGRIGRKGIFGLEEMSVLKNAIEINDYSALGENCELTEDKFNELVAIYKEKGVDGVKEIIGNRGKFNRGKREIK